MSGDKQAGIEPRASGGAGVCPFRRDCLECWWVRGWWARAEHPTNDVMRCCWHSNQLQEAQIQRGRRAANVRGTPLALPELGNE